MLVDRKIGNRPDSENVRTEKQFFIFQKQIPGFGDVFFVFLFQISVFLSGKNKKRHSEPKFWFFKNENKRLKNISDQYSVDQR